MGHTANPDNPDLLSFVNIKWARNIQIGSELKFFLISLGDGRWHVHKNLDVEYLKPMKELFHQLVLENFRTQFLKWWQWHSGVVRIL